MNELGLKMTQSRIVREAFEQGKLTRRERDAWLDELRRPKTFWEWFFQGTPSCSSDAGKSEDRG